MSASSFTGKRLFLLRHASTATQSGGSDIDRVLSPKGQEDAAALGKAMQEKGYVPDIILCSPAPRTRQTFDAVRKSVNMPDAHFLEILYSGSAGDYLHEIQQIDEAHQSILLIAHNPSIYELAVLLAAQSDDTVTQRLGLGYQAGALSVLHCPCKKWTDIQPGENELAALLDPMDYNAPARPTRWM